MGLQFPFSNALRAQAITALQHHHVVNEIQTLLVQMGWPFSGAKHVHFG